MEISEIIQGTGNNLKTKCIIDCLRFLKDTVIGLI